MPLYEYRCESCGDVFEVIQRFSDTPLSVHEKCGGKVERLISPPALQFKGSGWYITDYAKGGSSKSSGGEDGAKKTDAAPAKDKTTETKPAATPSSTSSSSEKSNK